MWATGSRPSCSSLAPPDRAASIPILVEVFGVVAGVISDRSERIGVVGSVFVCVQLFSQINDRVLGIFNDCHGISLGHCNAAMRITRAVTRVTV